MSVGAGADCAKLAVVARSADGHQARYFAADWSAAQYDEIRAELDRRGVDYTIDGDELCVAREHERMLDMLVESVTEE